MDISTTAVDSDVRIETDRINTRSMKENKKNRLKFDLDLAHSSIDDEHGALHATHSNVLGPNSEDYFLVQTDHDSGVLKETF